MSARELHFDFGQMEDWEIGAGLLAVLAWPGVDEVAESVLAKDALCASQLRVTVAESPEQRQAWAQAFPSYAAIDKKEERKRLRTFRRRLRDRMWAARMSFGFFYEALTHEPAKLPPDLKRLSLNALADYVQKREAPWLTEEHNFEGRVWRDSLPVIHLAAAMQVVLRRHPELPAIGIKEGGNYPLEWGDLHREVIKLAEGHERLVPLHKGFGKKPIDLVRIRMSG